MTEAKHSPMQITRAKLMQLPKEELVTELLGALRVVVSQHAATSLHAELVAALEEAINVFEAMRDDEINLEFLPGLQTLLQKARQK